MYQHCFDILLAYLKVINHQEPSGRLRELIKRTTRAVTVQCGETLCTHMSIPCDCWFVATGLAMEFIYDDMGQKMPLRFFRKEPVIPFGFVEQQPSPSTIQMITRGAVLALRHEELSKLLTHSPEAQRFFHLTLADYASRARKREQLLILPTDERIRYLQEKQPQLILSVAGKDLARYLNMSPYTYSRLKNRP